MVTPTLPATPSFRLDGKRALITGGGRGIGLAAASALAEAGAHVTLAGRSVDDLEDASLALCHRGAACAALPLDIRDTAAMRKALAAVAPFDILVNNAGANRPGPFLDASEDDFDFVMSLNVRAAFFVAQTVARGMIDAGRRGSIINLSSQLGHIGAANRTIYAASKHAVEGLTKTMAIDLAPHGIRVNALAPTFIETPMTRPYLDDPAVRASIASRIKLGRVGQPEDLTGAVLFLASDASALMTGASLVIDGGWTAG
ncbi:MAG TPA: SDR family NAD(P)-dependent oxidoreductase [Pseudolabrys sp.]